MKSVLAAAAVALLTTTSAFAADMAVKAPMYTKAAPVPMYSWTGFYIGVNGGGAFGTSRASEIGLPTSNVGSSAAYGLGHNVSGGFGGGQIGYNWQFAPSWVFGVEADYQGSSIKGTGTIAGAGVAQINGGSAAAGNFVTASEKVTSFGTARVRLGGLITPNLLLYGTGGAAFGQVSDFGQFHYAPATDYVGSGSSSRFGYSAGAGLEWSFAPHWSLKGEYLYVDLGNHGVITTANANAGFSSQFNYGTRFSIARAGVNYKF